jgi:hypothetical protein
MGRWLRRTGRRFDADCRPGSLAFLTMCVCIGAALLLEKAVLGHGVEQAVH